MKKRKTTLEVMLILQPTSVTHSRGCRAAVIEAKTQRRKDITPFAVAVDEENFDFFLNVTDKEKKRKGYAGSETHPA